jgi:hypothetical protein
LRRWVFSIGPVAEPIPDVLGILDIAFGIHDNGAENRINRISGPQPSSNCPVVKAFGCGGGSGIFLDRSIGVERVAFRVITSSLELLDNSLGSRNVAGLRTNVKISPSPAVPAMVQNSMLFMESPEMIWPSGLAQPSGGQ